MDPGPEIAREVSLTGARSATLIRLKRVRILDTKNLQPEETALEMHTEQTQEESVGETRIQLITTRNIDLMIAEMTTETTAETTAEMTPGQTTDPATGLTTETIASPATGLTTEVTEMTAGPTTDPTTGLTAEATTETLELVRAGTGLIKMAILDGVVGIDIRDLSPVTSGTQRAARQELLLCSRTIFNPCLTN